MRQLGRLLKIVALVGAPLAIVLTETGGLSYGWQELVMLAGMVCLFSVGYLLDRE